MDTVHTNNDKPLVSILIPSHGRPQYFRLALASALEQTYKNVEVIVSDDSEDDEIENIVTDFGRLYDNIRYFHSPGIDMEKNWQQCWDNMSPNSEFVNFLMDDDIFAPEKIEKMVDVFQHHPTVSLVTSYRKIIDKDGNFLPDREFNLPIFDSDTIIEGQSAGQNVILNCANWIGEPTTVLFKKKYTDGYFKGWTGKEKYLIYDFPLWLRLMEYGDVVYIKEPLSFFREHETNDSFNIASIIKGNIAFALMIQNAWNNKKYISSFNDLRTSIASFLNLVIKTMTICYCKGYESAEFDLLREVFNVMRKTFIAEKPGELIFNVLLEN